MSTRDYAIPIVDDGSDFFRFRHAGKIGIDRPRSVSRKAFGLALASPPGPVGAVRDALTCTSTMTYQREQGVLVCFSSGGRRPAFVRATLAF